MHHRKMAENLINKKILTREKWKGIFLNYFKEGYSCHIKLYR